jgi:hypothetical protein
VLAALFTVHSSAQVVDFGKYPDFKGQWVRTGPPNNWLQVAGPPPLTPEYQKVFADITADFEAHRSSEQLAIGVLRSAGNAGDDESL